MTNAFGYDMIVKLSREERTATWSIRQVRQKKFKILQKSFEIRLTNQNGYDMIGRLSREWVHGYAQNNTECKKFFKKVLKNAWQTVFNVIYWTSSSSESAERVSAERRLKIE